MEKHAELAAMMSKPLTPAERILVQLASGTANESPAGAVLMRLSVDEAADLETIIQEYGALSAACRGIPVEALTPGSVKDLVESAEKALSCLRELDGCAKYLGTGDTEPISVSDEVRVLDYFLSKFKGAQEVKPDVV